MAKMELRAGVARTVITPPKGIYLIGYGDRPKGNVGINDDLTATALALEDGKKQLAIVACDLLCINEFIVDKIRQIVHPILPIICCSHTHSGPIVYADEHYGVRERRFIRFLIRQICKAIQEACQHMEPVTLTHCATEAFIAINRREWKDGRVIIGEDPNGPVDHSVNVISITSTSGNRLATMVNYACHGTVLGPDNLLVSADWIGAMRDKVESDLGGRALFLQGATGDMNPRMGWGKKDCLRLVEKQGLSVAEAVIKAVQGKQKNLSLLPMEIVRQEVWIPFTVRAETPKPPHSYRRKLLSLAGMPKWMWLFTDQLLKIRYPWKPRIEANKGFWGTRLRVNAIRIGSLAFVTYGSEAFTEIGMEIKEKSPAPVTLFASITDGCIGYLPTSKAQGEGGYEVDTAPYAYRYPGELAKGADQKAFQAATAGLKQLWKKK